MGEIVLGCVVVVGGQCVLRDVGRMAWGMGRRGVGLRSNNTNNQRTHTIYSLSVHTGC